MSFEILYCCGIGWRIFLRLISWNFKMTLAYMSRSGSTLM